MTPRATKQKYLLCDLYDTCWSKQQLVEARTWIMQKLALEMTSKAKLAFSMSPEHSQTLHNSTKKSYKHYRIWIKNSNKSIKKFQGRLEILTCLPFIEEGAFKLIMYSGKIWVFMLVLHKIYFFGTCKLSTPESNSPELGWYWSEPRWTTSCFPSTTRHNNKYRIPSLSTTELFTL